MVKKIATGLLAVALTSSLYAENKSFIGMELGYAFVQGDVGGFFPGDVIRDHKGSDIEYGVRMGAQNEEWRTTLSYNYFDAEENGIVQNYEKGLVALDYFYLFENKMDFQPFIGASVGYINYESTNNIDMSGLIYGLETGIVFSVTDAIDIDLLYRYSLANAAQDDRDASLDHVSSVVFGMNYTF
ncbi:MAG: hypothetical protein Q9M39_09915 [Sulfurovum sp.]|nr:hypothetical protein [Sulfurovum sp.]